MCRVAQLTERQLAKPLVLFSENKRPASSLDALGVPLEKRLASIVGRYHQVLDADGDVSACGQTHQIERVRERVGLVQIVDPPDQATFNVAPSAEILHVQVPHGEQLRCLRQVRAHSQPQLHPAIEGGAQKGKQVPRHPPVLKSNVGLLQRRVPGQPRFVLFRRPIDFH